MLKGYLGCRDTTPCLVPRSRGGAPLGDALSNWVDPLSSFSATGSLLDRGPFPLELRTTGFDCVETIKETPIMTFSMLTSTSERGFPTCTILVRPCLACGPRHRRCQSGRRTSSHTGSTAVELTLTCPQSIRNIRRLSNHREASWLVPPNGLIRPDSSTPHQVGHAATNASSSHNVYMDPLGH